MGIRLRLTGPDGRDYVPGEPIDVFDGEALIGRVQSVTLSYDGTEVWVENFMTVDFEGFRAGALPRLVLAEVVNFIAERHPSVHMIGIELNRDVPEFVGREASLASYRSEILQSIGVRNIRVSPKPQGGRIGCLAVTGIWHYDGASVAALAAALRTQRAAYRDARPAMPSKPRSRLDRLLRRKP